MAELKVIFVVTHGDKFGCANPGMTVKGKNEVYALHHLISPNPPMIVIGTGKRHSDVYRALDFISGQLRYTSVVGDPDSMEIVDGEKVVILADGKQLPASQYTTLADNAVAAKALVLGLEDGTVICSGRPFMIALGVNGKSAAIYRVLCQNGEIVKIDELTATGVIDPALQK
jgi:hypothetical protein